MISESDILAASILIVDDQKTNVDLLAQLLDEVGYTSVTSTMDPRQVCALYRKNRYDLILLDLQMPGLDGLEALPRILRASPRSRVVVFSAMAATRMLEAALDAGASGYIVKGVSPKRIAEHLRRVATSGSVRPVQPWPLAGG